MMTPPSRRPSLSGTPRCAQRSSYAHTLPPTLTSTSLRPATTTPRISPSHRSSASATRLDTRLTLGEEIDAVERLEPGLGDGHLRIESAAARVERGGARRGHPRPGRLDELRG